MNSEGLFKPFLKWAGGKNWLIRYLPTIVGDLEFKCYHEPFLGGASVFFFLNPNKAFLSDSNVDLIDTYKAVRSDVELVISQIKSWPINETTYYEIRSLKAEDRHIRAARFIYLNRLSFNGIYRVNRSGEYNVPYGHRDNYQFDFDRIRKASEALANASITAGSYQSSLEKVKRNDLVFLDPPYTVAHNNNGFIAYNKKLFSIDDQFNLRKYIEAIRSRGAYFILTNAAHDTIRDIFEGCGSKIELSRFSGLGGKKAERRIIEECIFTNVPEADERLSKLAL
ncbi:DNA adenine methylase [Eggerthella timonensis]|uniref:DNA adenine methylase n=1 Tax=Eggerthella timonensis TaxID=1871008 RepID=UPI000C787A81|nr:Dam family site-specific DNA-(adenine-N6)-methyltransferase [Eggerthella timonensis]